MDIQDLQKKIIPILRENGVERASVFGSVARGEDRPESDIDILIRLGKPMGIFGYMAMIRRIEEKLGRKVDLVTEKSLNKFIKPYVERELRTIYEK